MFTTALKLKSVTYLSLAFTAYFIISPILVKIG